MGVFCGSCRLPFVGTDGDFEQQCACSVREVYVTDEAPPSFRFDGRFFIRPLGVRDFLVEGGPFQVAWEFQLSGDRVLVDAARIEHLLLAVGLPARCDGDSFTPWWRPL